MCRAIQELQQEAVEEACKALREMQQEAVEEAVGIAVEEAVRKEREKQQEVILGAAKSLMKNLSLSADQALSTLSLSESERAALMPMLQTQ